MLLLFFDVIILDCLLILLLIFLYEFLFLELFEIFFFIFIFDWDNVFFIVLINVLEFCIIDLVFLGRVFFLLNILFDFVFGIEWEGDNLFFFKIVDIGFDIKLLSRLWSFVLLKLLMLKFFKWVVLFFNKFWNVEFFCL